MILDPSKPRKSCSRRDAVHIFTFSRVSGQTLARINNQQKNIPKTFQNEYRKLEKQALILDLDFDDLWTHLGFILASFWEPWSTQWLLFRPPDPQKTPKTRQNAAQDASKTVQVAQWSQNGRPRGLQALKWSLNASKMEPKLSKMERKPCPNALRNL